MRPPTRKILAERGSHSYAQPLHPNPKLYKHDWRVFTRDSPWENDEFFLKAPLLSTAACVSLLESLQANEEPYVLYGQKRPRRFSAMPFDPESVRWCGATWAPALEDDPDPEWNGHR
jgi:hypothetical protein